jgi:hypothetical protein
MIYYYHLIRFHISNQLHIRNRINMEKTTKNVLENRRKLRVITNQPSLFQKLQSIYK